MKGNETNAGLYDWYLWGSWSYCSATCGDGVRWRRRACLKDPRTCPQTSRPNSLYYEKTQLQECQLNPCANKTITDKAMISSRQVGMSIAISAAIIAIIFILAKTLHCLSNRTKSCCKRLTENNHGRVHGDESTQSRTNLQSSGTATDGLSGPVYITITQEMITGGDHQNVQNTVNSLSRSRTDLQLNPIQLAQMGANGQPTGVHPNLAEAGTILNNNTNEQSDTSNVTGTQVTSFSLSSRQPTYANMSSAQAMGTNTDMQNANVTLCPISGANVSSTSTHETNFRPSRGLDIEQVHIQTISTGDSSAGMTTVPSTARLESDEATTEASGSNVDLFATADVAVYEPPSYESLFPLFKRNQTL